LSYLLSLNIPNGLFPSSDQALEGVLVVHRENMTRRKYGRRTSFIRSLHKYGHFREITDSSPQYTSIDPNDKWIPPPLQY
jgi:hypothetical protein